MPIAAVTLILIYTLIRSGDIAIASIQSRDVIRAIVYGIFAILVLIDLIFILR